MTARQRTYSTYIFFVAFNGHAISQSDTLFPNVTAHWDIDTYDWSGWIPPLPFEHTLDFDASWPDSVIGGLRWGSVWQDSGIEIGWIAVDSGIVYYRSMDWYFSGYGQYYDTTVQVLYDFTIGIGDTAYFAEGDSSLPVTVGAIDTVILWGIERRRYVLSNSDTWVLGVGSTEGLLRPFLSTFEGSYESEFCGNYLDMNSNAYMFCLPTVIGEPSKSSVLVAPVPASDHLRIYYDLPPEHFTLMDLRGIPALSGRVLDNPTLVDLRGLSSGVYFLRIGDRSLKVIVE